jgi:hypothetical protein
MTKEFIRQVRRLNIATHRDLGYFFSSLIIIYCISGIALNHVDDWNPDFVIEKKEIQLPETFTSHEVTPQLIQQLSAQVGEKTYSVYDIPSADKVKIYYDNASLFIELSTGKATYEKISRRTIFYESNVLHRNSLRGWKWVSDVFGAMLIIISITGLFILKGKKGLGGRGKWFVAAGFLLPVIALILHELA